jgi:hypothetical protein
MTEDPNQFETPSNIDQLLAPSQSLTTLQAFESLVFRVAFRQLSAAKQVAGRTILHYNDSGAVLGPWALNRRLLG